MNCLIRKSPAMVILPVGLQKKTVCTGHAKKTTRRPQLCSHLTMLPGDRTVRTVFNSRNLWGPPQCQPPKEFMGPTKILRGYLSPSLSLNDLLIFCKLGGGLLDSHDGAEDHSEGSFFSNVAKPVAFPLPHFCIYENIGAAIWRQEWWFFNQPIEKGGLHDFQVHVVSSTIDGTMGWILD